MVTCCSECGKHFDILYPDLWAYKTGSKIFCSWHCLRADERKEEDEMSGKLTQKQREEAVEIAIQGGDQIAYLKKECGAPNPWATWAYLKKKLEKENPVKYNRLLQVETLKNAGIDPKSKMPKNFQDIREVVADRFPPNDGSARIPFGEAEKLAKEELESDIYRKKPEEPAEVITVGKVPAVEIPEQPIQPLGLQGGVNYQLKVDEAKKTPVNAIRVTAVDTELGSFSLVEGTNLIMWDADPKDYVEMTREGWETLAALIPKLMQTLGVEV